MSRMASFTPGVQGFRVARSVKHPPLLLDVHYHQVVLCPSLHPSVHKIWPQIGCHDWKLNHQLLLVLRPTYLLWAVPSHAPWLKAWPPGTHQRL